LAFQKVPEPKIAKNRVHLDLWSTDIDADVARAVAAGAVPVGPLIVEAQGPFQVMADPEGNEFCFVG
jgi:predicted enzyme related to lactoylglutathione lyase